MLALRGYRRRKALRVQSRRAHRSHLRRERAGVRFGRLQLTSICHHLVGHLQEVAARLSRGEEQMGLTRKLAAAKEGEQRGG